ncbi:3-hydroxyacyl-CoA dehydrogenase NAD-binding domain-containing protein [Streptomyces sp. NPDC020807]|uniref:3-hydroxyacyl-CoA dehydrogenase NAD-binding domain-containing protein n=1 Tax=Streptomyces sp. NPDC020807 TaxID=3155119 RepID=UPI0033F0CF9B
MKVAVVGSGVIGASWTTLFLRYGHEVVATDPAPGAEDRLRAAVTGDQTLLTFTADVEEAVADAGFVQENGPERPELKDGLFAALDAAAPPETVLASSSSGLLPSRIQQACGAHPERVLVGHPFNPPHLIPLVEVVPGERTGEPAVEAAMAFYRSLGRKPIRLRQELPGHVANRLQAALWREAYSLVDRGAATVSDIDTAIAHGPGLRWALLGPFLNQHLSGGAGGIAHVLEHLGPPMEEWWADLGAPSLTPELAHRITDQVAEELAGTGVESLVAERDALLTHLIEAKNRTEHL